MEVSKRHGPIFLQLYLYCAKNSDGYTFALSQKDVEQRIGVKKTSFHKYIGLMIKEGYLVRRNGILFDFYETPYGEPFCPSGEQDNSSHGTPFPSDGQRGSFLGREIDNNRDFDIQEQIVIDTPPLAMQEEAYPEQREEMFNWT